MITRLLGDYNKVYCHIIHCQLSSSFIINGSIANAELAEPLEKEATASNIILNIQKITHHQFPSAIECVIIGRVPNSTSLF